MVLSNFEYLVFSGCGLFGALQWKIGDQKWKNIFKSRKHQIFVHDVQNVHEFFKSI